MSERLKFILLFLFLFAFRTLFGLSQPFFHPDETQTYLIGLKAYATGAWPYFGPDLIVTETGFYTQLPGALEGLLIALPLKLWPAPEAPFLLLNLLSLSALAFFARYLSRRLPEIPFLFLFAWISLLPWNLHESTNIINPSYLLLGSSLFMVGFLEALPGLSLNRLSPSQAFGLMGFGLFWDMQFHFSWLLLPPFVLGAWLWRRQKGTRTWARETAGFAAGSVIPLVFLAPTWVKYGLFQEAGGMHLAMAFNPGNFAAFFTVLARFLSLPCFEMPRFLGENTHLREAFLTGHPVLFLPGVFLWLLGLLQAAALLAFGFFHDGRRADGQRVTGVVFLGFLLLWASFWFTSKPPDAHIGYILAPLACVYSLYIWSRFARFRAGRVLGVVCLLANLWFQAGYLAVMMKTQSLYLDRGKVERAIEGKDYRILGERRPGSRN